MSLCLKPLNSFKYSNVCFKLSNNIHQQRLPNHSPLTQQFKSYVCVVCETEIEIGWQVAVDTVKTQPCGIVVPQWTLPTPPPPHTHKHPSSPPSSSPPFSPTLHQRRAVSIYISHQPPETCHHHTAWLSDPQLLSAMFLLRVSANTHTHSHTHLDGTGDGGWGGTGYCNCKAKLLPIRFCSQLNC